jgi:hypothetical protein
VVVSWGAPCRTENWVGKKIHISVTVPVKPARQAHKKEYVIFETPLRDGLLHSSQNLCPVRCKDWQGLRFCTELGICMRFDNIKFYLQFYFWKFIQTGFSVNDSKICTAFLLFYQNLVDFLQTNFTSNILCIINTYSEIPRSQRVQVRGKGRYYK